MGNNGLSGTEKKVAFSLASVFGLRMMGLFMIMPVFALYGQHLEGFRLCGWVLLSAPMV